MERNEDKMDIRELEDIQSENEQKAYESPSLMKLGKMQKLTLKGGSSFDSDTKVDVLPIV